MNSTLSLSDSLKQAIQVAQSIAREYQNEKFTPAHLLKALLHKDVGLIPFLENLDKDLPYIHEWADVFIEQTPRVAKVPDTIVADERAANVFEQADMVRVKLGLLDITPICVLVAICKPNIGFTSEQLKTFTILEKEILDLYLTDNSMQAAIAPNGKAGAPGGVAGAKSGASALFKYCIDKTSIAREGRIDPIVGRDKEVRQMVEILGRRSKPNVIIIGEPGVGKTALVDGFALDIINDNVPANLKGALLFELDLGSLVAGASYKGEVEDRLKSIIAEIKKFDKAILFIDEIHNLLDPKGSMGSGAANLLKPELARGEITVIGATTNDEYRQIIEKEQAFNRRFEALRVDEPDITTAIKMMQMLVPIYEKHHNITVAKDAIGDCVRLAKRYIKDRRLPDAAIDLLDRTMASIKLMADTSSKELEGLKKELNALKEDPELKGESLMKELQWAYRNMQHRLSPVLVGQLNDDTQVEKIEEPEELLAWLEKSLDKLTEIALSHKTEVDKGDIAAVIAFKTGIPIGKVQAQEKEKLLNMEAALAKRVIGQDYALKTVSEAILESRSGLNKPGQPIGSFFFLGPTGTGKTEAAKALADFLFNDEKAIIRFDMSEFKEEHSAALLYGAPPGYVGYEEGGVLVNKIRENPYAIVLFDEIEKAHPSVFDIFLQILDEGRMSDRLGKEGDFSNSLILFTSNIGQEMISEEYNKGNVPKSSDLLEKMSKFFRPEFLARLTEIVPFGPIMEVNLVKILDVQMKSLLDTLNKMNITLNITPEAKKKIALTGFNQKYGARQISGVIRTNLRRPISRMIISGKVKKGDTINVGLDEKEELTWEVVETR
jgi:ATP-dependent Clp protease ATP-binding subunit ClpB